MSCCASGFRVVQVALQIPLHAGRSIMPPAMTGFETKHALVALPPTLRSECPLPDHRIAESFRNLSVRKGPFRHRPA